ncbi:MAG: tRNA pseudouridine(13) synthase TruD [Phycisphaerales bacterium]|nr:tRNA pseudouridine(13) synthase TruD [Phycisphaerales bacterium]
MNETIGNTGGPSQVEKDIERWGPILGNPTPGQRLLETPILGGRIKERASDFLVDEIPLYEPSGDGEHLYLRVQKTDMAHSELLEALKRHFSVPESALGAAGMKDRIAVTGQTISVWLPGQDPPTRAMRDDRIRILWSSRHGNKLRRGHLRGNRFVIRIRGLDPLQAPQAWRGLKQLERRGVPNYFGTQRFGYRRNTQRLGALLLEESYEDLVEEILGTSGSWFPSHQLPQRNAFAAGEHAQALQGWGKRDVVERAVLSKILKGRSPREAIMSVSSHTRSFWGSALQSAIFNHLLHARIKAGTFDRVLLGDVAFKHDSRKTFLLDQGTMGAEDQQVRAERMEISPSGPIIGEDCVTASDGVLAEDEATIALTNLSPGALARAGETLPGARRPYRVPINNLELDSGFDDHGPYLRIAFDLPRGAYATVVLREILGDAAVESARRDSRDSKVFDVGDDIR